MVNARGDRRRRFAKACDACRKSKVRCDGRRPVCSRCRSSGNECHYADIQKPDRYHRRPNGPSKDASRTSPREEGFAEGDPVLALHFDSRPIQRAAQLQSGDGATHDAVSNNFSEPSEVRTSTEAEVSPRDTILGGNEDMRYFGPPSGVSLVSTAAQQKSQQAHPESWSKWTHPLIEPILQRRVIQPLPSWAEAFSLVSEFFSHEHSAFPCFNPPAFISLLGQQYTGKCTEGPAWWVSLNSVLAIAQRRRAETTQSAEADGLAWGYAANALNATWDILMRSTQLSSVQALLGISRFFVGTPNPQPSFMLIGCAVRLAHSIGLHVNNHDPSWSPADLYMRKRIFWVAVCLDRERCLRTGRPPCHDLNDIYVDPPIDSLDGSEIVTTQTGFRVNLFEAQVKLAAIQSSIYHELHSSESSPQGIIGSTSALLERLGKWCSEFAPSLVDNSVQSGEHHGLMRLYFSYYNAVLITNRAHSFSYWASSNQPNPPNMSTNMKVSIEGCLSASSSIVALTRLMPDKWKSFYWDIISITMSAAIILSISTLRNPKAETAETHIHSVSQLLQLFDNLDKGYGDTYLTQIRKICQDLYRKAVHALQSSKVSSSEAIYVASPECQSSLSQNQDQRDLVSQEEGISDIPELDLYTLEQILPFHWDLNIAGFS